MYYIILSDPDNVLKTAYKHAPHKQYSYCKWYTNIYHQHLYSSYASHPQPTNPPPPRPPIYHASHATKNIICE